MTGQRYCLELVLGPRPFAYVPREIARAGKALSHNAVALYAILSALAGDEGDCYGSAHDLGLYMGASPRSVRRWIGELERRLPAEAFDVCREAGGRNGFLIQSRAEMTEPGAGGGFAYVPLIDWDSPAWRSLERRLWIVLWSYSSKAHGCFTSMERLAKDCGADRSNVYKARESLARDKLCRVVNHRRASCDTLLYDGKQWNSPAPRGGKKSALGKRLKGRTRSQHQGNDGSVPASDAGQIHHSHRTRSHRVRTASQRGIGQPHNTIKRRIKKRITKRITLSLFAPVPSVTTFR